MEGLKTERMEIPEKKLGVEETAMICQMVVEVLSKKVQELNDLYMQLKTTYGVEMGLTGISMLACITSRAHETPTTMCLLGEKTGVLNLMDQLDRQFNEIKEQANG